MSKKGLVLTLLLFAALLVAQAVSQAEANSPSVIHSGSGLRYGGEVFWPFTEDNTWQSAPFPPPVVIYLPLVLKEAHTAPRGHQI